MNLRPSSWLDCEANVALAITRAAFQARNVANALLQRSAAPFPDIFRRASGISGFVCRNVLHLSPRRDLSQDAIKPGLCLHIQSRLQGRRMGRVC